MPKQMQFPAPDFVAEVVSPSTEHNDKVIKFEDYAAHGIHEYWIIDPETETVEQYLVGDDSSYKLQIKATTGVLTSRVIQGFSIPVRAIFDEAENLAALRSLL